MIQLAYMSFATDEFSVDDLNDIVAKAQLNNKPHEITGMLVYHENVFIQVLEGEEFHVVGLLEKIKKDYRHKDLEVFLNHGVTNRQFVDWAMELKSLNSGFENGLKEVYTWKNLVNTVKNKYKVKPEILFSVLGVSS